MVRLAMKLKPVKTKRQRPDNRGAGQRDDERHLLITRQNAATQGIPQGRTEPSPRHVVPQAHYCGRSLPIFCLKFKPAVEFRNMLQFHILRCAPLLGGGRPRTVSLLLRVFCAQICSWIGFGQLTTS